MIHLEKALDIFLSNTKYQKNEIKKIKQIHNGFTNISFLFQTNDKHMFQVRIGNDGGVVYRSSEKAILSATKNTDFIFYDEKTGNAIKKWIVGRNPNWLICRMPFFLRSLAKEIKDLHSTPVEKYKNLIKKHNYTCYTEATVFPNEKHKEKYLDLTSKYGDLKLVISHNDISPTNCLHKGKKVYLIDFEWGRINNEYWDLANFIRESGISFWHAKKLVNYYGDLDWDTLKDFIYLCTNFAYQWTFIMTPTKKIIKYRQKVKRKMKNYYKKIFY